MAADRVLVDEAFVSRLHHLVAVFAIARIEHVVRIGQPDLADRGQTIKRAGPDRDMTGVNKLIRRRLDDIDTVPREYLAVDRLAIE